MAPERFTTGQADTSADIYALTCVLHECLTGAQPFPGNSAEQQITAHLMTPPPRPSQVTRGVPANLDAVVAKGMAKNPYDRYPSPMHLAHAARTALTAPSATATPHFPPSAPLRQAPAATRPAPPRFDSAALRRITARYRNTFCTKILRRPYTATASARKGSGSAESAKEHSPDQCGCVRCGGRAGRSDHRGSSRQQQDTARRRHSPPIHHDDERRGRSDDCKGGSARRGRGGAEADYRQLHRREQHPGEAGQAATPARLPSTYQSPRGGSRPGRTPRSGPTAPSSTPARKPPGTRRASSR